MAPMTDIQELLKKIEILERKVELLAHSLVVKPDTWDFMDNVNIETSTTMDLTYRLDLTYRWKQLEDEK